MSHSETAQLSTIPPTAYCLLFLTALPVAVVGLVELLRYAVSPTSSIDPFWFSLPMLLALPIVLRHCLHDHTAALPALFETWGRHWAMYPLAAALCGATLTILDPTPLNRTADHMAHIAAASVTLVGMMTCVRLVFRDESRFLDRFAGITRVRHATALGAFCFWNFLLASCAVLRLQPVFGVNG